MPCRVGQALGPQHDEGDDEDDQQVHRGEQALDHPISLVGTNGDERLEECAEMLEELADQVYEAGERP